MVKFACQNASLKNCQCKDIVLDEKLKMASDLHFPRVVALLHTIVPI